MVRTIRLFVLATISSMSAILFLHGGGHSSSARYTKLIENFQKKGVIAHAFDHHANSLSGRLQEAENELSKLKSTNNLEDKDIFLWGSSMGGHVACRLVETHPNIKGIILQSAAAYSAKSESIPFGPDFTKEIRIIDSWADSPAFTAIANYQGPTLVMYGEFDDVIPTGVKTRFIKRADRSGRHYTLEGGAHSMLRPETKEQQRVWQQMYQHAEDFVLATISS